MKIPDNFAFSQNNLQDYVDCPRRFELRYLKKLAWPAIQSEPVLAVERHMQLGERFHRMLQQHQSGLPADVVGILASEPELVEWWQAYLNAAPEPLPEKRLVEYTLAAPFGGFRLVAKFDLLAIAPGEQVVIVDWKTSRKKPKRQILADRLQTRLYPFLLVEAGKGINGGQPVTPDQVELIYWFTAESRNPEHFPYSVALYEKDKNFLGNLIADVVNASQTDFPLTGDLKMCRFCNFRSLCNRGEAAGEYEEESLDEAGISGFELDFEQIAEIAF
ncbi:MAG TPA: PD-(D/E)XK nuclease family protein [Bellilinea sp.]|nr:PD-(D/E)XK nuclease family protein [Bellilinea sp.]